MHGKIYKWTYIFSQDAKVGKDQHSDPLSKIMIREKRMSNQAKDKIEETKEGGSTYMFSDCLKVVLSLCKLKKGDDPNQKPKNRVTGRSG